MKTIGALIFGSALFVSMNGYAQGNAAAEKEIRRLEDIERTAIFKGDTASLFRLWSPDYVVNNPNNMVVTARQIRGFIKAGGIDYTSFTRNIEKISFIKNTAIVMGAETITPSGTTANAGKTVIRRYTNVWIKTDSSWQLCARQATNIVVQ